MMARPKTVPTKKQMEHLKTLFAERTRNTNAMDIRECALALYKEGSLTYDKAEEIIETVEAIPRDIFQREIPEGMVIVPGFYTRDGKVFEVEQRATGRWAGYIYVYHLTLHETEDGEQAWFRSKLTRGQATKALERIFG